MVSRAGQGAPGSEASGKRRAGATLSRSSLPQGATEDLLNHRGSSAGFRAPQRSAVTQRALRHRAEDRSRGGAWSWPEPSPPRCDSGAQGPLEALLPSTQPWLSHLLSEPAGLLQALLVFSLTQPTKTQVQWNGLRYLPPTDTHTILFCCK